MDTSELLVVLLAAALIAAVLWYFFGAREAVAAVEADGVQQVRIVVKGGYDPDTVTVTQGRPVRLDFYRDETASCSEQVILGDFGIARDLPAFQTTSVEFTPREPGRFPWTCGMNMLRGTLVVRPA